MIQNTGMTAKCNGQNQTLSFTFSHCKYILKQKAHKNYFLLQVYNYTTCIPESKIKMRHKKRGRERERKRESEREGGTGGARRRKRARVRKRERAGADPGRESGPIPPFPEY